MSAIAMVKFASGTQELNLADGLEVQRCLVAKHYIVRNLNNIATEEYGYREVWWLEHESTSRTNYIDWKLQEG